MNHDRYIELSIGKKRNKGRNNINHGPIRKLNMSRELQSVGQSVIKSTDCSTLLLLQIIADVIVLVFSLREGFKKNKV